MTKHVGILGYPLGHTISPAFQQAAFDFHSLPVRYHSWPTPPDRLEEEVRKLRGEDYLGANVTVPHKESVCAYLDDIDTWARYVGAVNTIVREGGGLKGYNTDAYGFMKSLKEIGELDPRGKKVLVLGAGGVARAAVFGLANENVASITIANRTRQRAQSLADEVRQSVGAVKATSLDEAALEEASAGVDLIVNATSVGMGHGDAEGQTPIPQRLILAGALVYDLVYNPPETPLLRAAQRAGARTLGGLPMLIYQGEAAFERWTGRSAPVEAMFAAAEKALSG